MKAIARADAGEATSLAAARSGDRVAFDTLVAGHRRPLHLHCYRMLGSYHDAEEDTAATVHVELNPPGTPRLARALGLLLDEINTNPPHIPGDPRPITYTLTA